MPILHFRIIGTITPPLCPALLLCLYSYRHSVFFSRCLLQCRVNYMKVTYIRFELSVKSSLGSIKLNYCLLTDLAAEIAIKGGGLGL